MRILGKVILVCFALFGFLSLLGTIGLVLAVQYFSQLAQAEKAADTPAAFVLRLDLDQAFPERVSDPIEAAFKADQQTLGQLVAAIDQAANDRHVKGMIATLSGSPRGMADSQEIRDAILRFRASGKPAVVFSPSLGGAGNGTIAAYMASAFDSVWLQPSGGVDMGGFGVEVPFAHDALESIGVEADYGRRWEYKTALDPAIRQSMSAAHRASLTRLLESWQAQVADGLAQRPGLDHDKAIALLQGPPLLAQEAVDAGLVDQIGYWDQAKAAALESAGTTAVLPFSDYAVSSVEDSDKQIALIQVDGVIQRLSPGMFNSDQQDSDELAQAVHDAVHDPRTQAIVLRINSPGGSYVASDTLWRELSLAREKGLPVVVSMGAVAASGGYFIALPASKIVAQPGTVTGSIGVFGAKPVLAGLWEKLGVRWEQVTLSPYATMGSTNQRFTDQQRAAFEKGLDAAYGDFTQKVAQGRQLDMEMVDKVARGRIWTGADAYQVGLVDSLGGMDVALRLAKEESGLGADAAVPLQVFPKPQSPLEILLDAFNMGDLSKAARTLAQLGALAQPVTQAVTEAQVSAQGPTLLAPALGR
jgi:protease-4